MPKAYGLASLSMDKLDHAVDAHNRVLEAKPAGSGGLTRSLSIAVVPLFSGGGSAIPALALTSAF